MISFPFHKAHSYTWLFVACPSPHENNFVVTSGCLITPPAPAVPRYVVNYWELNPFLKDEKMQMNNVNSIL